ncbi:hypothetical protein JCM19231_5330 [Vibrio ishigakensis]|uniref:Uncharacterized protein n=1 Tax=Vibrio ishigakensis TaxID=1481914 RepID=A0A0B8NNG5_9VIBR|nr:hypothetical protein JCM19231_5330 [Vibrio ishigakensis]
MQASDHLTVRFDGAMEVLAFKLNVGRASLFDGHVSELL